MGRFRKVIEKIQAPTEPGLSTAQLMLVNDDLKPGKKIQINNLPHLSRISTFIFDAIKYFLAIGMLI
jgi:hypothetical protein